MLAKGYILICIGGGVTGDIQVKDTHVHHRLKKEYRERESKLMLEQLTEKPNAVPSPSRDDMMRMIAESWDALEIDPAEALKNNFLTNSFDGSEDYMVSDKLFELIGTEMLAFRAQMLQNRVPATLKDLLKTITPPKGVKRKGQKPGNQACPDDEGEELFDCEGGEIQEEEMILELEENHENQELCDNPSTSTSETSEPVSTSTTTPTSCVQLSQLTTNDAINADAACLEDIKRVLEHHAKSTSTLFIPYFCQFKAIYSRARTSLKKRVKSDHTIFEQAEQSEEVVEDTEMVESTGTDVPEDGPSSPSEPLQPEGRAL
jgi:hypothetical protein